MKALKLLAVCIAASSAVGCSTILTDDTQKINVISSSSQKFTVDVDGVKQEAPGIIIVKKENKDKVLKFVSDKCSQDVALNKTVEPAFFGNLLSGGVFGSTTDYATDSMWRYQDSVQVNCN